MSEKEVIIILDHGITLQIEYREQAILRNVPTAPIDNYAKDGGPGNFV